MSLFRPAPLTVGVIVGLLSVFAVFCYFLAWKLTPQWRSQTQQTFRIATTPAPEIKKLPPLSIESHLVRKEMPRWERNAFPLSVPEKTPKIAIIIDDMGSVPHQTLAAMKLPAAVTFSFLPYPEDSLPLAYQAHKQHHEIMIHLPMEPLPRVEEPPANPGPNALLTTDDPETIRFKVYENIRQLKDFSVGVNNHMGSRFTAWEEGMKATLEILEEEKLFFLDSLTTPQSATKKAAAGLNLPISHRHVFLDHYQEPEQIQASLTELEKKAKDQGYAIAIGHPHPETISALETWIPTLKEKGIYLVPISMLINQEQ